MGLRVKKHGVNPKQLQLGGIGETVGAVTSLPHGVA